MNLQQAQETVVRFGAFKGDTLLAIAREEPSYITDFLMGQRHTFDVWLREAVELMAANLPSAEARDASQGELFGGGDSIINNSTEERS